MIEIKRAKEIINYIARNDLCESYRVFPFEAEGEADAEMVKDLLAEYASYDLLVEDLRRQHRAIGAHLCPKAEKLPALLKMVGYMIEPEREDNSFFCGREHELLKMNVAINKKIKNNIMLVGDPGTGKTMLVEQFAVKNGIHNIFVVECAKLIGSTEYRGAFEQRTTDCLKYAKKYGLIIFFDEIHTLINLGKSTGGMSITDILKPYLLDDELVFIGATTRKEYQYFSEDEAFKRRFSMIKIAEPSDEELINIKCALEKTVFGEPVLSDLETGKAVERLRAALPTLFFPDKLIDFLDYLYSYKKIASKELSVEAVLQEFIDDYNV